MTDINIAEKAQAQGSDILFTTEAVTFKDSRYYKVETNALNATQRKQLAAVTSDSQWHEDGSCVWLPSFSTVCKYMPDGYGLEQFKKSHSAYEQDKILDESAAFGTLIHDLAENILKTNELDLTEYKGNSKVLSTMNGFINWLEDFQVQLYTPLNPFKCLEVSTVDFKHGVAGTYDLLCSVVCDTGKRGAYKKDVRFPVLVDYKTSDNFYESHFIKTSGYLRSIQQEGKKDVEALGILLLDMPKTKRGYKFKIIAGEELEQYYQAFDAARFFYRFYNPNPRVNNKTYPLYKDKIIPTINE